MSLLAFHHGNIHSRSECDSQEIQCGCKEGKDKDCPQQGIFRTQEGTRTHSKEASQRRDVNDQEGKSQA